VGAEAGAPLEVYRRGAAAAVVAVAAQPEASRPGEAGAGEVVELRGAVRRVVVAVAVAAAAAAPEASHPGAAAAAAAVHRR
jgi:hypothetical protein